MKHIFLCVCLLLFSLEWHEKIFSEEESFQSALSNARFEVGCAVGRFISIDRSYSDVGLFVPAQLSDSWYSYVDASGYRFIDGKWASSTGLGVRNWFTDSILVGVNAYYDYRRGNVRHNFHRVGIGLEWLTPCYEIRMNGYLPVARNDQTSSFCRFDQIGDGFHATRHKFEYQYRGFDAEFGIPFYHSCNLEFYIFAGPYYYFRRDVQHFWGAFEGVLLNWNSLVFLELRASHDRKYGSNVQGCFALSIPFDFFWDSSCKSSCDWFCYQPVRRNNLIQTDHCCDWTWNW